MDAPARNTPDQPRRRRANPEVPRLQKTLKSAVVFQGTGLHSGKPVRLVVHPAPADHGIIFQRTDLSGEAAIVPALWDRVAPSRLCTEIANDAGTAVSTIEHLMAALAGLGVANALVAIDGPEVPILDGSAAPYVRAILDCGLRGQQAPVRAIRVLRAVEVREGAAWARLEPADMLEIDFHIDFAARGIGAQSRSLVLSNGAFVRELCDSRTFCLQSDVEAMRRSGLALGGSLDNAVVFDDDRVLSPGGLRRPDEPVRHKMLDAMGDLALAGGPILGRYVASRAGHGITNRLLRALFSAPGAFERVDCQGRTMGELPGAGVVRQDLPVFA